MIETWKEILEFPGYSVSNWGRIRNNKSERIMVLTYNQGGITQVGLFQDGVQQKRSVTPIVAAAFLPAPMPPFDTAIQLDGNRSNNAADNLMWRPRWFAGKYHKQFLEPALGYSYNCPIVDMSTGERFAGTREAAVKHGLLEKEIFVSMHNGNYVFPTYQRFRILEEGE